MSIEIPYTDRPMHVYMPGKPRHGKSTLMFWQALNDIKAGLGVTVMDAKGDLVPKLLQAVPTKYRDKTIYLDINNPIPIDFMTVHGTTPFERHRSKERLVLDIKKLIGEEIKDAYSVDANISDVIYTLLDFNDNPKVPNEKKASFLDIRNFLKEKDRRDYIRERLIDRKLADLWKIDLPRKDLSEIDIGRITRRMNDWVRSATLQAIFGVPCPPLKIEDCFNEKRILLVKLTDDDISQIYGTLLISKLREAAWRQIDLPEEDRTPHFLYCDEFQHFQTSDFPRIISEAGGLGLCLTIGHQRIGQLKEDLRDSITELISTHCIFRVGRNTANALAAEIPSMETRQVRHHNPTTEKLEWITEPVPFDPTILTKLQKFEILFRRADGSASYESVKKWAKFDHDGHAEYIKIRTGNVYGCKDTEKLDDKGTTSIATPSDVIPPTPPKRVPANSHKAPRARTPS